MNVTKFNCPICNVEMSGADGESIHPGDKNYGYTLFCVNVSCSAQEVFGHGDNEKKAYEIVMSKYGGVKRKE
jgi:hypothetical protein